MPLKKTCDPSVIQVAGEDLYPDEIKESQKELYPEIEGNKFDCKTRKPDLPGNCKAPKFNSFMCPKPEERRFN